MKILQVAPAYFPALSIGGPILSTLALNSLLNSNGHSVTTLTTPLGLSVTDARNIIYDTPIKSSCGSVLIYQPFAGYPHFTWSLASLKWLIKHIKEFDLVMLQGVWNFPLLAAAWVCQRNDIPYILFPHGTLYRETVALRSGFKKKIMLTMFVRRMLKRAARIIFTTSDESRKVQEFLNLRLKSEIIPNIVDSEEFDTLPPRGVFRKSLGISSDSSVLLHLGRISEKKGLHTTLEVLSHLIKNGRNVSLLIVGGDELGLQEKLFKKAKALGVHSSVYFTGLLNRQQTAQALSESDIFILPSLSENFGIAVVEALLARIPVVISDQVGLAPDVALASAGIVVPLVDGPLAFADAVCRLLDDDNYRQQLGNLGRQFAIENYSSSAISEQFEKLFRILGK